MAGGGGVLMTANGCFATANGHLALNSAPYDDDDDAAKMSFVRTNGCRDPGFLPARPMRRSKSGETYLGRFFDVCSPAAGDYQSLDTGSAFFNDIPALDLLARGCTYCIIGGHKKKSVFYIVDTW